MPAWRPCGVSAPSGLPAAVRGCLRGSCVRHLGALLGVVSPSRLLLPWPGPRAVAPASCWRRVLASLRVLVLPCARLLSRHDGRGLTRWARGS